MSTFSSSHLAVCDYFKSSDLTEFSFSFLGLSCSSVAVILRDVNCQCRSKYCSSSSCPLFFGSLNVSVGILVEDLMPSCCKGAEISNSHSFYSSYEELLSMKGRGEKGFCKMLCYQRR